MLTMARVVRKPAGRVAVVAPSKATVTMNAVDASVAHLQWLFITVMALAITEGVKQFVREIREPDDAAPWVLRWTFVAGLLAFLFTAMPFTYGMVRYFFEAYRRGPLTESYSTHLAIDTLDFTIEALAFFVMSRTLSPHRSLTFAGAALVVFLADIVSVVAGKILKLPTGAELQAYWIVQDPIVAGALIVVILVHLLWRRFDYKWLHVFVCSILIAEALIDLPLNWTRFYFPSDSKISKEAPDVQKPTVYLAGPLFTQAEWRWNSRLVAALRQEGYEVIAPQEKAAPMLDGKAPFDGHGLFQANLDGIERCHIVVAILDGPDSDSGTSWECGYAHKKGCPVIGVRTDLRPGGDDPKTSVNLMLSQGCREVVKLPFDKRDDEGWLIQHVLEAIRRVEK